MTKVISLFVFVLMIGSANAQSTIRTELKRGDLTGKDMDVVVSVVEVPPGEALARVSIPAKRSSMCFRVLRLNSLMARKDHFPRALR